jgi:hypothetical protein
MAIIYLSSDGADANNGLTRGASKLTFSAANTAAGNGGTIIVDGVIALATTGYFALDKSSLTIQSYTPYSGTLKCGPSHASNAIYVQSTATGTILGDIIVDANSSATYAIGSEFGSAINEITFSGVRVQNFTQYGVKGSKFRNMTGSLQVIASGAALGGVNVTPDGAGTISLTGSVAVSNLSGTFFGFYVIPTASGCSADIYNVAFTGTGAGGSSNFTGVNLKACSVSQISRGHTFDISGFTTVCASAMPVSTTITVAVAKTYGITGSLAAAGTIAAGIGIRIGDDNSFVTPNITRAEIYQNTISGANHGIMFGSVNNGIMWGNKASYCTIGLLSKGGTAGNLIYGNIVEKCTDFCMYSKAGVNDKFIGNTVVMSAGGYADTGMYTTPDAATAASGIIFENNIIYTDSTLVKFAQVSTGDTATFANNNYYSTAALPANPFHYAGTNYASIAAWIAAQESSALSANPLFVDIAGGNYKLATGSPMWRAGKARFGLKDYRGRRRQVPPSIGAYEPSSGDSIQIARTARV